MIVEYDSTGKITHIINDPVPPHMPDFLIQEGKVFLDIPPVMWPKEPAVDIDGNPVMVQATDEEGEPLYTPLLDLDGNQEIKSVYDKDTDEYVDVPQYEPVMVQAMESNGWDSVPCDIMTDYILDGEIVARPVLELPDEVQIAADGVDEAVLTGLPTPCRIRVDGEEHVVEDGELVLTANLPTEYTIVVDQWPYMSHTVRIVAS